MKQRIGALLLALVLALACAAPALAAEENDTAVQTIRALGIMIGDENGNMNLSGNVTRAQFAKLLVASSRYRDSISPDGTGYSLYRDLKNDHWASEYIRIAAQEGWMTGYTDSTFRPENTITLEEVCAASLRLLGYDTSTLAGSFPYAHLSKASAIGLRDGFNCVRGQQMTRGDCAQLIYNLFSAQTASGQVYGTTLGIAMRDGKVDYLAVLMDKLSGPYVAAAGAALPFAPLTIYRDGKASAFATLNLNDVYYYSAGMRSVWIYTKRASGKIEAVAAANGTPSTVTVSGKTYTIDGADAAYRLSALAGTSTGSYVTLLLGMDDKVAGVLSGSEVSGSYYGVVRSSSRSASADRAAVQTEVEVYCTDGTIRTFFTARDAEFRAGSMVAVTVSGGGVDVHSATATGISGRVNSSATRIGEIALAENVRIIDVAPNGSVAVVERARLAGVLLQGDAVRLCARSTTGEITDLILNDVTGDTWTYGLLTEINDLSVLPDIRVAYLCTIDGKSTTVQSTKNKYPVETGGVAIRYDLNGALQSMQQISRCSLQALSGTVAYSEDRAISVAENVQVYLRQNGYLYLTELSAVNAGDYALTGWYDGFGNAAGGRIRIIVAEPKAG